MKAWLTRMILSQPVKVIAAEAAEYFIEAVATSIANSIIEKRQQKKSKPQFTLIKNEENNDVQLHDKPQHFE